jgi:hypothetical protein
LKRALGEIDITEPTAAKKLIEDGAGNQVTLSRTTNAKFLTHLAQSGFGKAQEMAKFPITKAIVLAGDVHTVGNDRIYDGIQSEAGNRRGIVNLAGPKAKLAFGADTGGNIPNPKITARFNPVINLIDGQARDTGDGVSATKYRLDCRIKDRGFTRTASNRPRPGAKRKYRFVVCNFNLLLALGVTGNLRLS